MLKISIAKSEAFDDKEQVFRNLNNDVVITIEHSLLSISKWESKWHKPFLSSEQKTREELIDYIRCMTIEKNIPDEAYYFLSSNAFKQVNKYIDDSMTATTFSNAKFDSSQKPAHKPKDIITSEMIYYWMITYQIPFKCETWHLNRLLTLIKICNIKNDSNNSQSKRDLYRNNHAINQARRRKH